MPENPSGKFHVVTVTRPPHLCCACGRGATGTEEFIDWNFTVDGVPGDFIGNVYLCKNCAFEIADVIGCLTVGQSEALKESLEDAYTSLNSAKSAIANYGRLLGDSSLVAEFLDWREEQRNSAPEEPKFRLVEQGSKS